MKGKSDYGVDSPAIVAALAALGGGLVLVARFNHGGWRLATILLGGYFLTGAVGMLYYSKVGKLRMRERLLTRIVWAGAERVLDVGCGRGLMTVSAAKKLTAGKVVGVDIWQPGAISGNFASAVLENARIEGVGEKVEVQNGDARKLPFPDASFDVVVSNYLVHEMNSEADRLQVLHEMVRVLKPGGQIALTDFIFTGQCVDEFRKAGLESVREKDGFLSFWIAALLNFGAVQNYHVSARKASPPRQS